MVATGLHRPNEGDELREVVGDELGFQHSQNRQSFCAQRRGSRGPGIYLSWNAHQVGPTIRGGGFAHRHRPCGTSFHGRLLRRPEGNCPWRSASRDHHTACTPPRFWNPPSAANCILDGNPLHEEQVEIVKRVGGALAVNTVIDEFRQPCFLNFGDIVQSHMAAINFMKKYAEVTVPRRFRTVITSSAGYPLDKTYYQTVKGMVGAMDILEPGGDLFIVSECSEGMGSGDYVEAQKRLLALGPDKFLDELRPKQHAAVDEWQTEMQLKPMRIGAIRCYTQCLCAEDLQLTGVESFSELDRFHEAIRQSVERSGDLSVAIIPEGPYVVPCSLR